MLNLNKQVESKSCISRRIKITAGNKATVDFGNNSLVLLYDHFTSQFPLPVGSSDACRNCAFT
jgi:hypothetical protein